MEDPNEITPTETFKNKRFKGRPKGLRDARTRAQAPAIQILADAGMKQVDIARRTGLSAQTVSNVLADVKSRMNTEAMDVLADWRTAIRRAASRGRHEPARDWLESAKVLEPVQAQASSAGIQVLVGVSLPGMPSAKVSESE